MTNRSKHLLAATLAALCLAAGAARAQAPARLEIAVLDVRRILAESAAGKAEIAKIKKVEDGKAAELEQLKAEVTKLQEKLTDLGFSISDAERTKLQREIEDRMILHERRAKDSYREIKGMYDDLLADFEKRIGPIVEQLGAERGILLILHRDNPIIAWADKAIDITGEIIVRFDKSPGGGGKAQAARP